jgi:hypothetical protein
MASAAQHWPLQRRSLLETHAAGVTLQNLVMEYATDHLIERLCSEIEDGRLATCNSHALLPAWAKAYTRQTQARLILQPIAERLVAAWGKAVWPCN